MITRLDSKEFLALDVVNCRPQSIDPFNPLTIIPPLRQIIVKDQVDPGI
jgi:hypothetical protein